MYFRNSKFLLKSFLASVALLGAGVVVAFDSPTGLTAPNCDDRDACSAPLNVGSNGQTKNGPLIVKGGDLGIAALQAVAKNRHTDGTYAFGFSQLSLVSMKSALSAQPTANLVGGINFDSWDTDGPATPRPTTVASIRALAAGTHSATNLATDLIFYTTPANAIAPLERMRVDSEGNVGIGANPAAAYKLDVNGDMRATSFVYRSDERLKSNIETLGDALSKVLSIRGVSFVWKEGTPQAGKHDIGVIAQEVEKVAPEAVHTDENGIKAVDYPRLVPLLINAIHEQQSQIDELKARLDALEHK